MIEITQLKYSYGSHEVLRGFDLTADYGEVVYVLGPNGAGKSTLFKCVMGQLAPGSGSVKIDGRATVDYTPKELAKKVAYIPQISSPSFNYSVRECVAMGRTAHLSMFASPSKADYDITDEVLARLCLSHLAEKGICEISGGERQLTLIARVLAQQAKIVVMDEPTSALDYGNQIRVQNLMRTLSHEGMLVLLSSHNPQYALQFADKVSALNGGVSAACGAPESVITPELMKTLYDIDARVENGLIIPKIAT